METPVVKTRGRPRKRRREEAVNNVSEVKAKCEENNNVGNTAEINKEEVRNTGNVRKRGRPPKKRVVEVKGEAMVGKYVLKEFEGNGVFLGKIVSYDSGLYRVDYEDGDFEDLDSGELREYLIGNERERFVGELLERKNKLDGAIEKKSVAKVKDERGQNKGVEVKEKGVEVKDGSQNGVFVVEVVCALEKVDVVNQLDKVEDTVAGNVQSEVRNGDVIMSSEVCMEEANPSEVDDHDDDDDDDNADDDEDYAVEEDEDSSSDAGDYGVGWETRAETEIPAIPPPELPPCSGTLGIPGEFVPHFFSVYGFLRTFSVRLFLSPFTLDDLVGCLRSTSPNTLLDAIHVALLRALRKHLETLSSEGSQLASKCLRSIDWSLLDMLTWPVYLVHYLMVMGHLNEKEWKGFYISVLEKDYCTLTIGTKLTVLQILCDDALDTEDIRSEVDTREESEVGVDSDGISLFESGLRNGHPRQSKTSIGKDRDMNSDAEKGGLASSMAVKSNGLSSNGDDIGEDGNGDECRLCGMEGMLVCCDGCPSAYHTRCIGVNKLSIPEGQWFCPECTINKLTPPITLGTSLRGAEVFGVDSYGQLFLGTCNHLLVLKVSVKTSSLVKYYSCNDIPIVLSALISSPHHGVSYFGICQAISRYWELPQIVLPPVITSQTSMVVANGNENPMPAPPLLSGENGNQRVLGRVEHENYTSTVAKSSVDDVSGVSTEKFFVGSSAENNSLGMQTEVRAVLASNTAAGEYNSTNTDSKLYDQSELFRSRQQGVADTSSTTGTLSCNSGFNSNSIAGQRNGVCLPKNHYMCVEKDTTKVKVGTRSAQNWKNGCSYMGSMFKPFAYINNYVHGDFAASAAANFAALSSDESKASEVHSSDPRKAMAANISLQVKAFSSAAVRFFWPSTEKKLIELPRERCSWCFHCKAPVTSRKACLLNAAALSATRGEMKFVSGLRLVKNVEGGLYGIAAYTLYMEESLRGLILGPFRNSSYREQWRRKVEQASTCHEMRSLVLDLERNLWAIALSPEWTKLVDHWTDESSVPQSAAVTGSTQKRGSGRRKKHQVTPEVTADDSNDSTESSWWRGGKLAMLVFQRGAFPCSLLRKAARQGGKRRLPGIYYAEGSDVPKRSRQFIWRAATEMAKNASQLALQVRYLDQFIKWSDLVRPEQNSSDSKGPETEAVAFRNAQICDKKIVENKIMYGVAFGHQKHLSIRLMKSIVEKEESEDGKEKYWFIEARLPLYLIKEYEENVENTDPPPYEKPSCYTNHQRRQLKAYRKEYFVYLHHRKNDIYMCRCASCHQDVSLGHVATCSSCEGFCHHTCMLGSPVATSEDKVLAICKQCSRGKSFCQANCTVESPTSPLAMQGQEFQNSGVAKIGRLKTTGHQNSTAVAKSSRLISGSQDLPSKGNLGNLSDKKSATSGSKSKKRSSLNCGLIWKKKSSDAGSDFQLRNILFRGSADGALVSPTCLLCRKPYNPHLMYIFCDVCQNWYHADSVGLDESKLADLVGFKCCRCRRIRSPVCPFADLNPPKKTLVKKIRIRGPRETVEANSGSEAFSEQAESLPSTPMSLAEMEEDVFIEVDDPLLVSVSQVEQMPEPKPEVDSEWDAFGPGPQKLPVRRQVKSESDDDGLTWNDFSSVQLPTSAEMKNEVDPHTEWDISTEVNNGDMLNYDTCNFEGTDFEPQTYFSFTELLEADDGNQFGVEPTGGAWDNLQCDFPPSGFMDPYQIGSFDEHLSSMSAGPAMDVRCEVCHDAASAPDLVCLTCGIQMHSHCSPWDESPQADSWKCGQCRDNGC